MSRSLLSIARHALLALCCATPVVAQTPLTIRAGTLIDGRGGVQRNVTIVIDGAIIARVDATRTGPVTYDFSRLTVMPGMIDTHVHIDSHFNKEGRAQTSGETAAQRILAAAENAYVTLMAGFTTVQSIGSSSDLDLREAIERGTLPGPRLLTSTSAVSDTTLSPDSIRAWVRNTAKRGADLIKIFASKSIREGGGQTMTDAQIRAACEEAAAVGKRIWVHAHAASAVRAATSAGCTAVTHGSQVTNAELALMAQRGTYFEPNIGLVTQNYLENKPRYLGIGNYDEAGFKFMEDGIAMKLDMFKRALRTPGLKLIMGTDATAGAHGQNARETIYRVQKGSQAAMDALVGLTSLNAAALGLARIGAIASGMQADIIALDGNPLTDITALQRVVFVMKGGTVYKNIAPLR
jgi:imidazolonepropionase-like amidohydrolase